MDWSWRSPRTYFKRQSNRVIFSMLDCLESFKDYHWEGIHEAVEIRDFLKSYGELLQRIRKLILEGRIGLPNCMMSDPQLVDVDDEMLVRNVIEGKKYYGETFNINLGKDVDNSVMYLADITCHHSQMPQIAKKLGYFYYKIDRPSQALNQKGVPRSFWWEGLDGSRILCHIHTYGEGPFPSGSNHSEQNYAFFPMVAERFRTNLKNIAEVSNSDVILCNDSGDWKLPSIMLTEFVKWWNERLEGMPRLKIATLSEFFHELEKGELPIYHGILDPVGWSGGIYGFRADHFTVAAKRTSRALVEAEIFSTLAYLLGADYPSGDFAQAWRELCYWLHHAPIYYFDEDYWPIIKIIRSIEERAKILIRGKTQFISQLIDAPICSIIVLNACNWNRIDVVSCKICFLKKVKDFYIVDIEGKKVKHQVISSGRDENGLLEKAEVLFTVHVPSVGYATYSVVEGCNGERREESLKISSDLLENRFYRIKLEGGLMKSVIDKEGGREFLVPDNVLGNELLVDVGEEVAELHFKPNGTVRFKPKSIEIMEKGPVRGCLRVKGYVGKSPVCQEICIYDEIPRIDLKIELDCLEKNMRYRVAFPLKVSLGKSMVVRDIHFGAEETDLSKEPLYGVEREGYSLALFSRTVGSTKGPCTVCWADEWAALTDNASGMCLINTGHPGYMIEGNVISNILLQSLEEKNQNQFKIISDISGVGKHEFKYAIYFFNGNWRGAHLVQRAREYLHPLITTVKKDEDAKRLPRTLAFLKTSPENLVMTSLYLDDKDVLLRLYECAGREGLMKIEPFIQPININSTDLLKNTIKKEKSREVKPYEIVNLKCNFEVFT
jgi:alpha-mannosidase